MLDRAVARAGYAVYQQGKHIGNVTSGAPSPTLKCSIGFASIESSRHAPSCRNKNWEKLI